MAKYLFTINAEDEIAKGKRNYYGVIDQFEIEASSEEDARGLGFSRFCNENPDHSHNLNDYTISCKAENT